MKAIRNLIRVELKYLWFSKIVLALYILFAALMCISLSSNVSQLKQKYEFYNVTYNNYVTNGEDPIAALQQESKIVKDETNGSTTMQNPLRYDYDNVCKLLALTNPNYIMLQSLEFICFVICTITFGVFGVYVSTFDYKWKTSKVKAAKNTINDINIAKIVSSLSVIITVIIIALITAFIFGSVFYYSAIKQMDLSVFKVELYSSDKLIWALCFVIYVSFIFYVIGYTLGVLFKKSSTPIIIILLYNLLIPSLGKYDLKNAIATIGHEIFIFKGSSTLIVPVQMTLLQANFSLIIFVLICLFSIHFVSNKQSKYVS